MVSNALNSPPLRWLGKVSYSIYMVHLTIMLFLTRVVVLAQRKWLPDEHDGAANSVLGLGFAFLAVALVLVTSEFSCKWIELAGQNKFRKFAVRWFGHR